jgi:hypothetical protein
MYVRANGRMYRLSTGCWSQGEVAATGLAAPSLLIRDFATLLRDVSLRQRKVFDSYKKVIVTLCPKCLNYASVESLRQGEFRATCGIYEHTTKRFSCRKAKKAIHVKTDIDTDIFGSCKCTSTDHPKRFSWLEFAVVCLLDRLPEQCDSASHEDEHDQKTVLGDGMLR